MENDILVIDDEKPILSMCTLLLESFGYGVITAENGEEGLRIFADRRPSIVLTDIKMPGMDGLEVLAKIKEADPLAEVIVITGHGDMDIALKALNLNATDFISKPIDDDALEAALKRAKERLQLARQKEDEISSRIKGDVAVIEIKGSITSRSEPYLLAEFDKSSTAATDKIVVGFSESSSINGAGIAIMIQLMTKAEEAGQTVAIAGLSENFRKVFEMAGITRFATVHDSMDEALAALQ